MRTVIIGIEVTVLALVLIPVVSAYAIQEQDIEILGSQCQLFLNSPPDKPRLWGATDCEIDTTYYYYAQTTDPDNDEIRYAFDFGDGCAHTVACCYDSGELCETFHRWEYYGTYQITVIAMDEHGECSEPSDSLVVSVPKSHDTSMRLCLEIFVE